MPDYFSNILVIPEGAFVPLTMEGNIVVDGVLASCYAAIDHNLAHIGMTPLRWFPDVLEWMFGEGKGSESYVQFAGELAKGLLPCGQLYKASI